MKYLTAALLFAAIVIGFMAVHIYRMENAGTDCAQIQETAETRVYRCPYDEQLTVPKEKAHAI